MKIGVILASTRDGRLGERVAKWVISEAGKQEGWEVKLLDVKAFALPVFHDATLPAAMNAKYRDDKVTKWSQAISDCDGFIFLTPEYNHGLPAPLKNALDWLYPEWGDKAAAIVSYSGSSDAGIRAGEQLRQTLIHLGVANVQISTRIPFASENVAESGEVSNENYRGALATSLAQLDKWARALKSLR